MTIRLEWITTIQGTYVGALIGEYLIRRDTGGKCERNKMSSQSVRPKHDSKRSRRFVANHVRRHRACLVLDRPFPSRLGVEVERDSHDGPPRH